MGGELDMQLVRPGICFGAVRDVFLLYYRESPTVDDLWAREHLVARTVEQHPQGITFLSVIDAPLGAAFPAPESRAETARQLESIKGVLRGGAMVITGGAVRVSLTKMLLSRLPSMIRGDAEMRFFADVDTAAQWCLQRLDVGPARLDARKREILHGIARMRTAATGSSADA